MAKKKIKFRLYKRIFAIEVDEIDDTPIDLTYDEHYNHVLDKLAESINLNNEKISVIFFEEIEVVCSDCGISLSLEEEQKIGTCVSCENQ